MGGLLRFIIFALLVYLILRWLRSFWREDRKPRVQEKPQPEPRPYQDKDVVDVKFSELPPEEADKSDTNAPLHGKPE